LREFVGVVNPSLALATLALFTEDTSGLMFKECVMNLSPSLALFTSISGGGNLSSFVAALTLFTEDATGSVIEEGIVNFTSTITLKAVLSLHRLKVLIIVIL